MMRKSYFILAALLGCSSFIHAQARKIDTTMKVGKTGYRVYTSNKSAEKNSLQITPIGFEKDVRDFQFEFKGRLVKAEVDDINRDNFPDLVMYVVNNDSVPKGNVIAILSEKNESLSPVIFPDIFDDPKLRVGYKGNDVFFLLEGYLVRRFPVYPAEGAAAPANGGTLIRQVQYQVVVDERGTHRFKPMRSYEFTKP